MIYIYNTGMYYGVQADSQPSVFDVSTLVATYSENNWFENQGILREVNGALVLGPLSPEASAVNARIEELKRMGCKYIETDVERRSKNPFTDLSILTFSFAGKLCILLNNYYLREE